MKRKNAPGMVLIIVMISSCQKTNGLASVSDIGASVASASSDRGADAYSERSYTSDEFCSLNRFSYVPGQCTITDIREYSLIWMPVVYTETFRLDDDFRIPISVGYYRSGKCMDPTMLYGASPLVFQYSFADEAYGSEVKQGKVFCIQPMTKEFVDEHCHNSYPECPIPSDCYAIDASISAKEFLEGMGNSRYVNISLVPNAKADGYQYDENLNRRKYLEFEKGTEGFWSFELTVSETEIKWVNVSFPNSDIIF